jgi:hypothetical protein
VQTRAELQQHAGTNGQDLNRPRVCIKAKIKQYTGNPDLKKASGIENQGLLRGLGAITSTEKEDLQKRKQMKKITKTIRQTEKKTINQQDPDRIQKAP